MSITNSISSKDQEILLPGTILLEKYRVERVLGKGGMGIVVAARHVHLGELFAIKMILPEAVEQPEALERFMREARACAKLKGEHVARVHDIGKLPNGMPYMLMEHLTGEDLGDLLARRGPLPLEEAALYVYQACEAIAEAHGNGIVHRDLKPSNLFLTHRPNGSPSIKVLDFGISKELDPNNKAGKNLTKTGSFLGSPMYMPPEQMADIKNTDERGDIWALGVLFYELVTGEPPFLAEAVTSIITKVLLHHPEPPSRLRAELPAEIDAVIMRCLEKQPALRYASAHELMNALDPFITRLFAPSLLEKSLSISRSQLFPGMNLSDLVPPARGSASGKLQETIDAANAPAVALAETIPGVVDQNALPKEATAAARSAGSDTLAATVQKADIEKIINRSSIEPAFGGSSGSIIVREGALHQPDKHRRSKVVLGLGVGAIAIVLVGGIFWSQANGLSGEPTALETSSPGANAKPLDERSSQPIVAVTNPIPEVQPAIPSATVSNIVTAVPLTAKTPATISRPATTAPSKRVTTKKSKIPGYDD